MKWSKKNPYKNLPDNKWMHPGSAHNLTAWTYKAVWEVSQDKLKGPVVKHYQNLFNRLKHK